MERFKPNRLAVMLGILLGTVLLFHLPTTHAKKITIRLTTVQMTKQQMGAACLKIAKLINDELGDRVNVKVYPAAQLYKGKEEIEALSRGEIEMSYVIGSKMELLDPTVQILKLPFLFRNVDEAYKILDGKLGKEIFKDVARKGVHLLGVVSAGTVVISNSKRPLKWPKDFKGLKLRSFGRMGKDTLQALGAVAVVIPSSEAYSALQQGVIDGVGTPNSVYLKRKYNTVQKYVTNTGTLNIPAGMIVANLKFWNGLPTDLRSRIDAIVQGVIVELRREMKVKDQKIFDKIRAVGNEVHSLTPEQVAAWKKALKPIYEKYGAEIGTSLIEKVMASLN